MDASLRVSLRGPLHLPPCTRMPPQGLSRRAGTPSAPRRGGAGPGLVCQPLLCRYRSSSREDLLGPCRRWVSRRALEGTDRAARLSVIACPPTPPELSWSGLRCPNRLSSRILLTFWEVKGRQELKRFGVICPWLCSRLLAGGCRGAGGKPAAGKVRGGSSDGDPLYPCPLPVSLLVREGEVESNSQ